MKYNVTECQLKRGGKGLMINVPGATVMSSRIQFIAGSSYVKDYEHKSEAAHLMEHMAFGANRDFKSVADFETVFTKNGAYHNAGTGDIGMTYESVCADFEWDRILQLQAVSICTPKFTEAEFKSEMGNVRSELSGYLSEAGWVINPLMCQALGDKTKTVPQSLESLDNITVEDIREHWRRTHTMNNMRFIMAGDFTGDRLARAEEIMNSFTLPEGERFERVADKLHSAPAILVYRENVPEIVLKIKLRLSHALNKSDHYAMMLLNHILTSTMRSRINGDARRRGLAYYVTSGSYRDLFESGWNFSTEVSEAKLPELMDLIVRELKRVCAGDISTDELDAAKSYRLGRYQMGIQTVEQLVGLMSSAYFLKGEINNYAEIPELINAVTVEQMVRVAKEFFAENCWVLGLYGKTSQDKADQMQTKFAALFDK